MVADPNHGVDPAAVGDAIAVTCPCGKTASVKAEFAGQKVRCDKCKGVLVVPSTIPEGQGESLAASQPHVQTLNDGSRPKKELYAFLAPPQAADELGRLGPYRVLKVLGAGGMGVVFKAEDPGLKRFVALKAMLPAVAENESAKERFLREARAAAALKHDHVVNIHQVGEDRGVPYLAMEFLDGESLEDRLKREGRLPIAEVLRIGREIADGLGAAHERGLIHRDIKPANVWMEARSVRRKDGASGSFGQSSRAKILDFGLARGADDATLTKSGMLLGTPAYMPPEQANGEKVDARCDLYSLGVVLYRMATGQLPFQGPTIAVLAALISRMPEEPRQLNPAIPARLNELIVRLLSKRASERPASAHEVYSVLDEFEVEPSAPAPAEEFATMVSAPPPTKPAVKSAGGGKKASWPLIAVGAGGMAILALLCAIVLYWQTPHGTVRIETDDPKIEIVFDQTGPTIKGASKTPISLHPGPHGLLVKRGDFEFLSDRFEVKSGDIVTLKVALLKDKVEVLRDGKALTGKATGPALAQEKPPVTKKEPPEPKETPKVIVDPRKEDPKIAKVDPVKPPPPKVDPPPVDPKPVVPAAKETVSPTKAGEEIANSIGMKLVSIPRGKFTMGSPESEKERSDDEVQHEVEITKGFWLGKYAVTQAEYEAVMGTNPSQFKGPKLPVETVSWNDAKEFCRKLSVKEGKEYTLPTEAEWEYACRAGTKGPFSTGENLTTDQANYNGNYPYADNPKGEYRQKTMAVGSFAANGFGLYDMHGNVCQWCEDWYGAYEKSGPGVDPQGPLQALFRVIRGGGWNNRARNCRSAVRSGDDPTNRDNNLGFRVALRSVK